MILPKKIPALLRGFPEACASNPTKPSTHFRPDGCTHNDQPGRTVFISDNNAKGWQKLGGHTVGGQSPDQSALTNAFSPVSTFFQDPETGQPHLGCPLFCCFCLKSGRL
jgi:hypothetical protein